MVASCWRALYSSLSSGRCRIMGDVGARLTSVVDKVRVASSQRNEDLQYFQPRLVAVSKTKPVEDIVDAYAAGQRVFGENYVQELLEKSSDPTLLELCPELRWHFIGSLQRKKAGKLARLSTLALVETVDSARLADTLNAARQRADLDPLPVMVQVNTSGEQSKGGVAACEAETLVRHVQQQCPALLLTGLMTIGAFNHDVSTGPNPDFQRLLACREDVCRGLGISTRQLELSMGMSSDYQHAILMGSTNVRVGSEIFGARQVKSTSGGDQPATPAADGSGDAAASPAPAPAPAGSAERLSAAQ